MTSNPSVIEDELPEELSLGWYTVAYAPVRYRALERGRRRFAWTLPASRHPTATGTMAPPCYALVLVRNGSGAWVVEEMKGFEIVEEAERWARSLWRDAAPAWER